MRIYYFCFSRVIYSLFTKLICYCKTLYILLLNGAVIIQFGSGQCWSLICYCFCFTLSIIIIWYYGLLWIMLYIYFPSVGVRYCWYIWEIAVIFICYSVAVYIFNRYNSRNLLSRILKALYRCRIIKIICIPAISLTVKLYRNPLFKVCSFNNFSIFR